MLKNSLLTLFIIFLFSACSLKIPDFLTFGPNIDYEAEKAEANLCQNLDLDTNKLACYEKIQDVNSFAMIRLGNYYIEKEDFKQGLKFLNSAYDKGNSYANLPLALVYYKGKGVRKDISKSFDYLEEASQIDPLAAFQLSRFYLHGINTKIDYEKGLELLNFAATHEIKDAQNLLADIYKQGLFNQPKDQLKFEFWQEKAKNNKEDNNSKIYMF